MQRPMERGSLGLIDNPLDSFASLFYGVEDMHSRGGIIALSACGD